LHLPIDAALRASRADPAIFAFIVDAKDDNATFIKHMRAKHARET
jgi:hypothetical protein